MLVDEKFNIRKCQQIECDAYVSMNLAPNSTSMDTESTRVKMFFRDYADGGGEHTRYLNVRMSRKEAKKLGEQLLQYGNGPIQGEPGYEEKYWKLGG